MLQREFTEEQDMFRDAYRKFLATEIVPHMEAWREAGIVDREAFRKGILALLVSELLRLFRALDCISKIAQFQQIKGYCNGF